jgi:hypothetical protein
LLASMAIERSLFGLALDAHVGHVGQPPPGDIVEMIQRAERPAVEQARLDIGEEPLLLALGLGPPRQTGKGLESIVRGERQEKRIVEWTFLVVTQHHDLYVVVEANRRYALQVLDGADVLADRGCEVLGLDEA